jgi:hypothetical protein
LLDRPAAQPPPQPATLGRSLFSRFRVAVGPADQGASIFDLTGPIEDVLSNHPVTEAS